MNTRKSIAMLTAGWLAGLSLFIGAGANAAGLLTPAGEATPLSIRDHDVRVTIVDGYVVTEVEQVFANDGASDLEAVYSFPVPEHGTVAEFSYWVDGKPVTGEVVEREQARQIYEDEKAAGRETALAEKDAYRTFDISVYPVRAGQDVRTRLVYLQSAHTDTGIGRYVYPLAEGGVDEERLAFWEMRDAVSARFSFSFELKSSYPVDAMRLPGQPNAQPRQLAPGHWRVDLADAARSQPVDFDEQIRLVEAGQPPPATSSQARLDHDIVVYWRHQEGLPGSVDLVTFKPDSQGRGTFMLTLTPGDDLGPVTAGRDWIFVLDVSGSMAGKLATLAEGVSRALQTLRPEDRFRIVLFSDSASELTHGFVNSTPENVAYYVDAVRQLQTGGGTNLHAGVARGLRLIEAGRPSGVVLVTDGVANVGQTARKRFLKLLEQKDVRLFTFIMGNSANRPLLEAMTEVSNGFSMSASTADDVAGQLQLAVARLGHHAMHDVDLDIDGVKVSDIQPKRIGSVYRGEQLIVMGHYWKGGQADVQLRATVDGQERQYRASFDFPATSSGNPELERLWAYRMIEALQDEIDYFGDDADRRNAIQDLAIDYGLVTNYTSMIVVREEVYQALGIARHNRDRVAGERQARADRSSSGPVDRRVDQAQPMFSANRPAPGGGTGAVKPEHLFVLLALALARWGRERRRGQR